MKISFDLYDTVEQSEHLSEVFFTKDNRHYFNRHELNGKYYGFLKLEQVKTHAVGDKQFFKMKPVANPETEIVETMTREEILASEPVEVAEIFITGSRARAKAKAEKVVAKAK